MTPSKKSVYRAHGFTCAGSAGTFEKNVQALPGVKDAQVNFGAAKLTVYGEATIEELERVGAFEGLKVFPENQPARPAQTQEPILKRPTVLRSAASAVFLIAGWWLGTRYGEHHLLSVLTYGLSILAGGYRLFLNGLRNLARLRFDMNALMTVAIIGAAAIGEWSEGAVVVLLFAASEALESYSMDKARRSIRSLMDIASKEATVRRDGAEMQVPVDDIRVGDRLIVKPGQQIAADGEVADGSSTVNQAAVTGESIPVAKSVGDDVFAGALNEDGWLEVEVTKTAADSTLARIIHLVEEAQARRAPAQKFVDRFARIYTPIVLLASLGVALLPPLLAGADWTEWIYRGLDLCQ